MPPRVNQKNLTQPLRPAARYRPGKAPVPARDDDSDSDENRADDDDNDNVAAAEEQAVDDDQSLTSFGGPAAESSKGKAKLNVALKQVQVDERGKVIVGGVQQVAEESDEEPAPIARPAPAAPAEESSEYETDSEEEESEEEEPPKPLYKPVFVSKRNRDTIAEREKELDPEVQEQKRLQELEERKKQAHDLVAETIMREIAEKQADSKQHDVDDTDGLDPEGEFQAWKLRELQRLKRDKEAAYAREKEREEVEARRQMPEPLRLKEDLEHARKTREEKQKGQQAFLQKYHHKGAFYSDSDVLKKHDYTAPTVSTYTKMDALPKILQNKNFGKRSQSKYTHLVAEDTSSKAAGWASRPGQASSKTITCFHCGGPHLKKDCPQLAADQQQRQQSSSGPSSNRRFDERNDRDRPPPRRYDDDDRRGGSDRRYDDERSRYRRRSRSPSPRRRYDDNNDRERYRRDVPAHDDKRRRVD